MFDFRPQFRWVWDGSRCGPRRVTAAPAPGEQWEQFLMLGVPHIEFGGDHNFGRLAPYEKEKIRAILSKKFFIMSDHEQAGFKTYRSSMLDATLTKPYCLAAGRTDPNDFDEFNEFMALANRIHDSDATTVSTGIVDATTRDQQERVLPSAAWFQSLTEQPQCDRQPANLYFPDTGPVLETELNGKYKIFRIVYDPSDDLSNPPGHKCDYPFWCDYCRTLFQKEDDYTQHMMLHAVESDQQFAVGPTTQQGQAGFENGANHWMSELFDFDAYYSQNSDTNQDKMNVD
ncbi:hypothetical protein BJ166DRAFT_587378 [Pestalotiopsis sp. NC0098]|nr:hypothetical protein BJ166DRAFT_587378 [Pestalotiopsis sp. NC0098]